LQKQIQNTCESELTPRPEGTVATATTSAHSQWPPADSFIEIDIRKSAMRHPVWSRGTAVGWGSCWRLVWRGPSEDLPRPVDAKTSTTITIRRVLCEVNANAADADDAHGFGASRHYQSATEPGLAVVTGESTDHVWFW